MTQNTSDCEIVTSRLFTHARERIFDAFSDADTLAKWWGPDGFRNTFHSFDFQSGGQWQFTMHSPDGHDFKNECVFKEVSKPSTIIIEHVCSPKFVLEIILSDTEEGTLLSWRQRFETPKMRDKIATFAVNANEENLDRLASILA
jgi:uncharacterized protein YndB with AHSA1/START domain